MLYSHSYLYFILLNNMKYDGLLGGLYLKVLSVMDPKSDCTSNKSYHVNVSYHMSYIIWVIRYDSCNMGRYSL